MKKIILLVGLSLFLKSIFAVEFNSPLQTIKGVLRVNHDSNKDVCSITLDSDVLFIDKCEGEYDPGIIGSFKFISSSSGNAQIVVIQRRMGGNACNGGPLILVELTEKYNPTVVKNIDFCGGQDPILKLQNNGLLITFPGGPLNRGSGYIPTVKWLYKFGTGMVSKAK